MNIRMKEIRDQFTIRAIQAESPRNPVWKHSNHSNPAESDFGGYFARAKQMNGIVYDKHWSNYLSWKQSKYNYDKKSHGSL